MSSSDYSPFERNDAPEVKAALVGLVFESVAPRSSVSETGSPSSRQTETAAKVSRPKESGAVQEFLTLLQPVPQKEVLSKMARTDLEIEQIKEDAQKAGLAQGYAEGFEQGRLEGHEVGLEAGREQAYEEALSLKREELDTFHEELQRTVEKVQSAIAEWFKKSEPALSQLAVLIAQRIVAKELVTDSTTILSFTEEAVSEVTHATHARIKIRPFDSEILESHRADILAASHSVRDLEFVEDESLIGGCVIETDGGVVDATVDMKFREMLDQIRRAV